MSGSCRAHGPLHTDRWGPRGLDDLYIQDIGLYIQCTLASDGVARVLFHAEISQLNREHSIVELSSFVEEDGSFRYIAGITRPARELGHGLDDPTIDHWDCAGH